MARARTGRSVAALAGLDFGQSLAEVIEQFVGLSRGDPFHCLRINADLIPGGAVAMKKPLEERGIASAPRYIQKPAFMCEIFQKRRTFGNSQYPFTLARPETLNYNPARFPGTFTALEGILVLPWNERYTDEHVQYIADSVVQAVDELRRKAA